MRDMAKISSAIGVWAGVALFVVAGRPAHPVLRAQGTLATAHEQAASPATARRNAARSARLTVTVPHADTILSLDGRAVVGTGTTRIVETPPIKPVEQRSVRVTASWNPNGYTTITGSKILRGGGREDAGTEV